MQLSISFKYTGLIIFSYRNKHVTRQKIVNNKGLAVFSGSPRPHWPAVHRAALNWGNGVMSASWLRLKPLKTARFNRSHNPLLHPAGCWDDNGGRNTEALHQPWYDAIINYRGCRANHTHTLYLWNVSNEERVFGWGKTFTITKTTSYKMTPKLLSSPVPVSCSNGCDWLDGQSIRFDQ